MVSTSRQASKAVLLQRNRLVFPPTGQAIVDPLIVDALELELVELGFVLSTRLRARLEMLPSEDAPEFKQWVCNSIASSLGANRKHRPLFRKFPHAIPEDTHEVWVRRVLTHFYQRCDQECVHCRRVGTTHVLNPCEHIVCDHCYDGENYSACPICNRRVDQSSPFFKPSVERSLPAENVRFKILDLGEDERAAIGDLFLSFCVRAQAMSPDDRAHLQALVRDWSNELLDWLPETIPVKENVAIIVGTLLQTCPPAAVLEVARPYLRTATDVLRVLAAYSDADPSLQGETIIRDVVVEERSRWWGPIAKLLGQPVSRAYHPAQVPLKVRRFKLARVRRPLRRAFFSVLESFDGDTLTEDMLRHRSYWVWVGQLLHPHEYASRYPKLARAFAVVRKKSPTGEKAPRFQSFQGRVEAGLAEGDVTRTIRTLRERPGELARRLDHLLRVARGLPEIVDDTVAAFTSSVDQLPTPMLLTLRNHFLSRTKPAPIRIYWPKGGTAGGISAPDQRSTIDTDTVRRITASIEVALLARFGTLPRSSTWLLDRALEKIMVPFNERTASPSAIALPRGSTIDAPVPAGKSVRLFLHWCEPNRNAAETDIDLSVGFYDSNWAYRGVCSYYELQCQVDGKTLARSAGDLTSAPYPDGSSEFVDIDCNAILRSGVRYAVMVVNAYAGLAFSQLDRAFAGYMVREDIEGKHFDARTVEMKFNLQGERGIYVPVVFDFVDEKLHWLDLYSKGTPALNNVETSNKAIQKICPEAIAYFESGVRMSMYELALFHAAARADAVVVRDSLARRLEREKGESDADFLKRLISETGTVARVSDIAGESVTAALLRGDIELAQEVERYIVFPEKMAGTVSASDWLS